MARKTKLESQKTYELIVDTAEQLFSSKGFSQTTLHDIAQHAELSRGAIYWHFKDKTELLDAILARAHLPWDNLPQQPSEIATCLSPAELATFLVRGIETIIESPRLYRVSLILLHTTELVEENPLVHARLTCTLERIRRYIVAMLSVGNSAARAATCPRIERAANLAKTLLTGVVYEALLNPDAVELGPIVGVLEQTLGSQRPMQAC